MGSVVMDSLVVAHGLHCPIVCGILEKAMAAHSSTLAWKVPWTEEPGGLPSMGLHRIRHDWATSLSLSCIEEGNGNPLQCSCLENPRDGGAWWAADSGVAQSRTRLKQFSSSSSTWEAHAFLKVSAKSHSTIENNTYHLANWLTVLIFTAFVFWPRTMMVLRFPPTCKLRS